MSEAAEDLAERARKLFSGPIDFLKSAPKLEHLPSHYWRKNCLATFMDDPRGLEQIEYIGVDRVLWSSDYPHPEGTYGDTPGVWQRIRELLGESAATAIMGGNAQRVYGFTAP